MNIILLLREKNNRAVHNLGDLALVVFERLYVYLALARSLIRENGFWGYANAKLGIKLTPLSVCHSHFDLDKEF